jgi:hypothetical protein
MTPTRTSFWPVVGRKPRDPTRWFVKVRRNTRVEASTGSQYARIAFESGQVFATIRLGALALAARVGDGLCSAQARNAGGPPLWGDGSEALRVHRRCGPIPGGCSLDRRGRSRGMGASSVPNADRRAWGKISDPQESSASLVHGLVLP